MYGFMIENQGSSRFLVYSLSASEELDQVALGMLSQNKIPNLLPVSYTRIDERRVLRYSGLSMGTLKSILSGMVTRGRLLEIFDSICTGVIVSEEYLLDAGCFVLDPEYIYVDGVSSRAELVYLPIQNQMETADYSAFFKGIIVNAIPDPKEDSAYITKLLYYLNSTENFSIADFSKLVKKLRAEAQSKASGLPDIQGSQKKPAVTPSESRRPDGPGTAARQAMDKKAPVRQQQGTGNIPGSKTAGSAGSAGTAGAQAVKKPAPTNGAQQQAGSAGTTGAQAVKKPAPGGSYGFDIPGQKPVRKSPEPEAPLPETKSGAEKEDKMSMLYLLRNFNKENLDEYKSQKAGKEEKDTKEKKVKEKNTKEKKVKGKTLTLVSLDPTAPVPFTIQKTPFLIGRRSTNDGVISGKKDVSRDHCRIVQEKGCYYVIDENSKFGTKVDGVPCAPGQKVILRENSILELPEIRYRAEFR